MRRKDCWCNELRSDYECVDCEIESGLSDVTRMESLYIKAIRTILLTEELDEHAKQLQLTEYIRLAKYLDERNIEYI